MQRERERGRKKREKNKQQSYANNNSKNNVEFRKRIFAWKKHNPRNRSKVLMLHTLRKFANNMNYIFKK